MGLGRGSVVVVAAVVVAISFGVQAREPKPLAERIDEATKAAVAARGLAPKGPLRVREVSARELAEALGEEPVEPQGASADAGDAGPLGEAAGEASAGGAASAASVAGAAAPAPMLLDDDLARACLLGLRAPEACMGLGTVAAPRDLDSRVTSDDDGARGASASRARASLASLASLAAGVYLPRERALLVRRDEGGAADGTVLLHEAVHALQDAHFGLAPMLRADRRGADALAARHAFVEGDATFAVLRDANLLEPVDGAFVEAFCRGFVQSNRRAARAASGITAGAEASGASCRERGPCASEDARADAVVAPYVHGTRFVWSLYARGGWRAVNAAWKRPPETTEQLLHTGKYLRREGPLPLPRPPAPPAGFEARGAEAVGELELRTWLGAFLGEDEAARLAAGWGNGVAALYARGDERALTLRVRWDDDTPGRAQEVVTKLAAALGGACTERGALGPIAIGTMGRDLLVRAGPAGARCDAGGR